MNRWPGCIELACSICSSADEVHDYTDRCLICYFLVKSLKFVVLFRLSRIFMVARMLSLSLLCLTPFHGDLFSVVGRVSCPPLIVYSLPVCHDQIEVY